MTIPKSLVPAYDYPADGSTQWQGLRSLGDGNGLVVVNPNSGAGASVDGNYVAAVNDLREANVQLLGYVDLDFGMRGLTSIMGDIAKYREWYGITDIFFDQFPSMFRTRVARVLEFARSCGVQVIAVNPGVVPDRSFDSDVDIVCEFEGTYDAYVALQHDTTRAMPTYAVAHLVYSVAPQFQAHVQALATSRGVSHLALSPDAEPHPWGTFVVPQAATSGANADAAAREK